MKSIISRRTNVHYQKDKSNLQDDIFVEEIKVFIIDQIFIENIRDKTFVR